MEPQHLVSLCLTPINCPLRELARQTLPAKFRVGINIKQIGSASLAGTQRTRYVFCNQQASARGNPTVGGEGEPSPVGFFGEIFSYARTRAFYDFCEHDFVAISHVLEHQPTMRENFFEIFRLDI